MTRERFEDLPVWNTAIALAEGLERGTMNELLSSLYIARGSA